VPAQDQKYLTASFRVCGGLANKVSFVKSENLLRLILTIFPNSPIFSPFTKKFHKTNISRSGALLLFTPLL
jgi:hypothetical protein